MTLFETLIIIILLIVISHIAVSCVTYSLCNDFTIFCPKDIWEYTNGSYIKTILIYSLYTIFAPIFGIIGLVVWIWI